MMAVDVMDIAWICDAYVARYPHIVVVHLSLHLSPAEMAADVVVDPMACHGVLALCF